MKPLLSSVPPVRAARRWAVVPLKSPQLAKSRLADVLAPEQRRALFFVLARQVLAALSATTGIERVAVVTASDEVAAFAGRLGADVLRQPEDGGTAHAFAYAIEALRPLRLDQVLMIAGDLPFISPQAVQCVCDAAANGGIVVVPDRHGVGTNALLCAPPGAIEPAFGPHSLQRHLAAAQMAGIAARRLDLHSLAFDLDVPDDLALLSRSNRLSARCLHALVSSSTKLATAA